MQPQSARQPPPSARCAPSDVATVLLLGALVVLVLLTYGSYGVSNDEPVQQRYGELIIAYYSSGFADRSLFSFDNLYLYGGLFDVAATLIAQALGTDLYSTRHLLCALIGIGGIAATWATARLIAGPRAGLIAAVALAVCGAWYGAMFNHTKDVPFATAMMGATYWLMRTMRDLPRARLRDVLPFGVMLGMALGLRVVGLLFGFYLAAATLLTLYSRGVAGASSHLSFVARCALAFAPGLVIAYLIMIAAWPWSAIDPLNPLRALSTFAQFSYEIRDVFAGEIHRMTEMPRSYLPTYLAIRLPLAMLAGAAAALVFAALPRPAAGGFTSQTRAQAMLLVVIVALPVAVQVAGHSPIFSGMRHFTFVVPPLAVLAGIGFDALITALARWRTVAATTAAVALVASLAWTASILVRLHPHEYLFYNALVGGLPGAANRYATDYWVNVMPEAVRALESYVTRLEQTAGQPRRHYNVVVCAQRQQFEHAANDRLHWTDTWEEGHFFIAPMHMGCDGMLDGKVIATIERMGVVIGVVKDRRAIIGQDSRQ